MLEVKLAGQHVATTEVAKMATKPSLALLQKHLLGGCTIDNASSI